MFFMLKVKRSVVKDCQTSAMECYNQWNTRQNPLSHTEIIQATKMFSSRSTRANENKNTEKDSLNL